MSCWAQHCAETHSDLLERPCGQYLGITPRPLEHIEARQVNDSSVGCVVNVTLRNVYRVSVCPP